MILFINTLCAPYYDKLIRSASKNFTDMVLSYEMIDNVVKKGKMENREKNGSASRKKKGEA